MKKILSIFLSFSILVSVFVIPSIVAKAETTVYKKGTVGANNEISWEIDKVTGTGDDVYNLVISPSEGYTDVDIPNYAYFVDSNSKPYSSAPWVKTSSADYRGLINGKIRIKKGISKIGSFAFAGLYNAHAVSNCAPIIGEGAFKNCYKLVDGYVFSSLRQANYLEVGKEAFLNCGKDDVAEYSSYGMDFPGSNISSEATVNVKESAFEGAFCKCQFYESNVPHELNIAENAFNGAIMSSDIILGKDNYSDKYYISNLNIGKNAFANCKRSINPNGIWIDIASDGVANIGEGAFSNINIGSFRYIGKSGFSDKLTLSESVFENSKFHSSCTIDSDSGYFVSKNVFKNVTFKSESSVCDVYLPDATGIDHGNLFSDSSEKFYLYLNDNIDYNNINTDFHLNNDVATIKAGIATNAHAYALIWSFPFESTDSFNSPSVKITDIYSNESQTLLTLKWTPVKCSHYIIVATNLDDTNDNPVVETLPFYCSSYSFGNFIIKGKKYSFKIAARYDKQVGPYSDEVYYTMMDKSTKLNLTAQQDGKKAVLNYNQIKGADGYKIYCKSELTQDYSFLTTTTKNSYTTDSLFYGLKYSFKVVPFKTYSGTDTTEGTVEEIDFIPTASLSAPVVKATKTTNSITLTWNAVKNAATYKVFRKVDNGEWELYSKSSSLSFTEKSLENHEYKYKVCAIIEYQSSDFSQEIYFQPLDTNKLTLTSTLSNNTVKLEWSSAYGADGYQIWRCLSNTSNEFILCKDKITALTYTDKDLLYGAKYSYKVRGYKVIDGVTYYTDFSSSNNASPTIELAATTLSAVIKEDGIQLSWSAIPNAGGYQVLVKMDNQWKVLDQTTALTYTYSNLADGTTYTFAIRGYRDYVIASKTSNNFIYTTLDKTAPVLILTQLSSSIKLSWVEKTGADSYDIYKKTDDGAFAFLKNVEGNSLTDSSVEFGRTYTYKIKAKKAITNGFVYGSESKETPLLFSVNLDTPSVKFERYSDGSVKLSWAAIQNAKQYQVYKMNSNKEWVLVSTVSSVNYAEDSLISGKVYSYKVRAVCNSINGSFSKVVEVVFIDNTVPEISVSKDQTTMKTTINIAYKFDNVKYQVYKKVDDGAWSLLISTYDKNLTDSDCLHGHTYSYKVQAMDVYSDGHINSPDSNVESVYYDYSIKTQKVSLKVAKNNLTTVTASWKKISGAEKYAIYQKIGSGKWTKVTTVTKLSHKIKNLKRGKSYSFKVIAIGKIDSSKYSNVKTLKTLTNARITINGSRKGKNIKFVWSKAYGADKYEVYICTMKNRVFKSKGSVKSNKYTLKNCSKNTQYFCMVRPYQLINNKKYYGKKSYVVMV